MLYFRIFMLDTLSSAKSLKFYRLNERAWLSNCMLSVCECVCVWVGYCSHNTTTTTITTNKNKDLKVQKCAAAVNNLLHTSPQTTKKQPKKKIRYREKKILPIKFASRFHIKFISIIYMISRCVWL